MEPLQYILGTQPFGLLEILCEPGVLIPRWETEEWTMKLIDELKKDGCGEISVLDACTGSGCIPLLVKNEMAAARVTALDYSDVAIALAQKNKERSGLEIEILKANVLEMLQLPTNEFTLITSNPPYIPLSDYDKPLALNGPEASVRLYEPRMALVGHLEFYRALVLNYVIPLKCRGLVFELGYEDQVQETIVNLPPNWSHGRYFDLTGNLRCVIAWENGSSMELLKNLVYSNLF